MLDKDDSRDEEYDRVPSEERLLSGEEHEDYERHERRSKRRFRPIYLHAALILVYSAIYLALVLRTFSNARLPEAEALVPERRPHRRERTHYRQL